MNFNLNTNEDWLIYSDYLEENNQLDKADYIREQLEINVEQQINFEPNWEEHRSFSDFVGDGGWQAAAGRFVGSVGLASGFGRTVGGLTGKVGGSW